MTDYQTSQRMTLKERAIPLPEMKGKSVLDIGCDHGHWCWLAAVKGAAKIVGLDRGRKVKGEDIDLCTRNDLIAKDKGYPCSFDPIDLGKQWKEYGRFDVVFCFSMYHHVFENCGDHRAIWFWLWRHTAGELLWENPTDDSDSVVRANVSADKRARYAIREILEAAESYFETEFIGPALHVPTRKVYRFKPRPVSNLVLIGKTEDGQGGATKAFNHADGRRIREIEHVLGVRVLPGSLNARLERDFEWDRGYYRAQILDLTNRDGDFDGMWLPRWARFYPVIAGGHPAFAFRFEGERYPANFVELIAETKLRKTVRPDGRIDVRSR